jgi:hypothetical protein
MLTDIDLRFFTKMPVQLAAQGIKLDNELRKLNAVFWNNKKYLTKTRNSLFNGCNP